ncbi:NAD(P)-binding domain-containing protein [Streptomyces sp. NPDC046977]|uniref:NAD(P)-binding domain-containing protein n=1 Tax=Streptomyces sp. NPDC046977 TaxID=3154703 RepID=UPI0033D1CC11
MATSASSPRTAVRAMSRVFVRVVATPPSYPAFATHLQEGNSIASLTLSFTSAIQCRGGWFAGVPRRPHRTNAPPFDTEWNRLMTKTLGLIGSGMIGGTLARLAVAAGWNVVLSNSRGPETLGALVAELGERARAATPAETAEAADLVVVTVPLHAHDRLPREALAGRTVLDTLNYYPQRDGHVTELDSGELTSSELVQRHLSGARVVKAFNSIGATQLLSLARPAGAADRSALPIAGDDAAAKAEAAALLNALGYDAVDTGSLADSWRSEPNTPLYCVPYVGDMPSGLDRAEFQRWFFEAPGVPVPAQRVKELADAAERGPVGGSL